ncbi:1-phosphofructokinase [Melissococcus plutonius]|uniref:Tagatose-6-phosphate kinase n=2 Tax=Melissococcus plutonius TaxID=33970 RepID=F3Y9E6_MELPT|nr:1-phosphofructokinase [Melissococcus plutonius]BAL62487.1 tagatose-6-phosphate kinase/1-phosphofructokinase [Melissococcus plutonius DAT561]AIM24682.1 1-phosphofructokinase FruK [Melissococcus plutonius S1]KMT24786.1 1-phosphofructokinase FruK [Melissococcus plutonius]KMT26423.1 1-phosphofructokinase FruK [Melissococcus plutonius]KMT27673.1 1-phosphofructokinase FruK [Melissococcus plutonius]
MIYTVTLNPSIDYVIHVDQLNLGEVNRMTDDFKLPGGKGINVSRILQRMAIKSTALGFLGGFTGNFIKKWLDKEHILTNFTTVSEDTRINVKLKAETETEINGQGPNIRADELTRLKESLSDVTKGDIVVLAGSIPSSIHTHFYEELIQYIKDKEAEFVIDTTGKNLLNALKEKPLLVKPNNHELADLYQTTFHSLEDIFIYGNRLLSDGAQYALVSMAGDGALLFTKEGIYQSNVLKRPLKNSVGAGDSMIAGFVGKFAQSKDPVEAFKWGVACGSATAFSDDLATAEFINELLDEVVITKLIA